MGRPKKYTTVTLYRPRFCNDIVEWGREGLTPIQWASKIGVRKTTIQKWKDKWPDFAIAYDYAFEAMESYWVTVLQEMINGQRPGNWQALKYKLSAMFPHWREKSETEHSGSVALNLNVKFSTVADSKFAAKLKPGNDD